MVVTHFMRVKMLDPNKHGIYNKETSMKLNWPIVLMLFIGLFFWFSIFYFGFFQTIIWSIIISSIVGIIIKLYESRY